MPNWVTVVFGVLSVILALLFLFIAAVSSGTGDYALIPSALFFTLFTALGFVPRRKTDKK
jgi:O-antigen ligase